MDPAPAISVIIPALDEQDRLPAALASLGSPPGVELILVDGGSQDATRALARQGGARVLASPPGRGRQMALGAEQARGELLVFLHADTRLQSGWRQEVARVLALPGVALGAFQFRLDQSSPSLRLIEKIVFLRSRYLQMPYGDQALFITAARLRALGGFPQQSLMEDVELVRRARRQGRVTLSPLAAISSARRWQEMGPWHTTLHNWSTYLAYLAGVSPQRLLSWYYRANRRKK